MTKEEYDKIFDQAFLVGVEFGYKQCEKGKNIQAALSNANFKLAEAMPKSGVSAAPRQERIETMATIKFNQTFHKTEADELFPAGCKCTSTNGGGDCDWCQVYYNGPECNCLEMALSGNGPMMQNCHNPNCQYYRGNGDA